MKKYVFYLRVSTKKQGNSGLGLEAQRQMAYNMFGEPIAEFVEVESGKNNNRPQVLKAIALCKEIGATLVVAKMDRLARNAAFIFALRDSGVDFVAADNPHANTLTVNLLAVISQDEVERIRKRIKEALAVKKEMLAKEGKRLGCPNVTKEGKLLKDIILENRAKREYSKPDLQKVETLKILKQSGQKMTKISEVAEQLFGKRLSNVTLYSYLNKY